MFKLIVWIIVALLALSFFGISLQKLVEGPTAQANFHFLFDLLLQGWDMIVAWVSGLGQSFRNFF